MTKKKFMKDLTVYRQQFYFETFSISKIVGCVMFFFTAYTFFMVPALFLMPTTPELQTNNQFIFYVFILTFLYFLIFMASHKNNPHLKEIFEWKKKVYVKPEKILKKEVLK